MNSIDVFRLHYDCTEILTIISIPLKALIENGATCQIRTDDLMITNQLL